MEDDLSFDAAAFDLDDLADTDPATGLSRGVRLIRALHGALDRGSAGLVSLVAIGIDDHPRVGAALDDADLRAIVASWTRLIRHGDILARDTSEDLLLLLCDCPLRRTVDICERLKALVPRFAVCSMGIASWDGHETAERFARRTTGALTIARQSGGDRVVICGEPTGF